jgi:hypothetical protein
MYAALLGEVDSVRLLAPERLREISAGAFSGVDEIMGFPSTWALGYSVGRIGTDARETPSVFGVGASVEATRAPTPLPGSRSR